VGNRPSLEDEILLHQLEELANRLGIAVRHEPVSVEESSGAGGLCRLKGKYVLIIHSQASVQEKVRLFIDALKQFPLSGIYIKPALRELLEGPEEP
jgi:hypothetical protein